MKYDRAIEAAAEAMGIPSEQIATDLIDGINAAAPIIAAQALRDAAANAERYSPDDGVSPYWLRRQAQALEGAFDC